jgi:hypothetical protein
MKGLSDLRERNIYFENAKTGLEQKLKVAVTFLDRNEFINAEMERIVPEYLESSIDIKIKDGKRILTPGPSFDYSKYSLLAFRWLNYGNDPLLSQIVIQAKREYAEAFKDHPGVINSSNNSTVFEDTIIAMLSRGVGYLLYKKYLQQMIAINSDIGNTLNTNYTHNQLRKLYNLLLEKKYIKAINENDFIYFFSGKPLNNIPKIFWVKSKGMVIYMLEKICLNFSLSAANNCIQTNRKKLDSNDRTKTGYQEIDDILKLCDS